MQLSVLSSGLGLKLALALHGGAGHGTGYGCVRLEPAPDSVHHPCICKSCWNIPVVCSLGLNPMCILQRQSGHCQIYVMTLCTALFPCALDRRRCPAKPGGGDSCIPRSLLCGRLGPGDSTLGGGSRGGLQCTGARVGHGYSHTCMPWTQTRKQPCLALPSVPYLPLQLVPFNRPLPTLPGPTIGTLPGPTIGTLPGPTWTWLPQLPT